MNDMDLLAGFRASVPEAPVSPRAEARFQTLIAQRRSRLHRAPALSRRVRLALVAPVAAGAAAAVALSLLPGSAAPTLTVKLLADEAATAALQQQSVSPGQWVYRELEYKASPLGVLLGRRPSGIVNTWDTADGTAGEENAGFILLALFHSEQPGLPTYADLGSLPSDPAALERYLADDRSYMSWADPGTRAFDLTEAILAQYVVPPRLLAELYRALADIPGVTVNTHARDIAGRPGVAFAFSSGGLSEIILNPQTDAFMAMEGRIRVIHWESTSPPRWIIYRIAIIREAFVSGNGVLP